MKEIEKKLADMNLVIPVVPIDTEHWRRSNRAGDLIFVGTTGPWPMINKTVEGKWKGVIGRDITVEEGKLIARMSALSVLAVLKNELGDLDRIEKIVMIGVHMHAQGEEFYPFLEVADAACDLFIQLFGENGRATRTIMSSTDRSSVQIEAIVQIKN